MNGIYETAVFTSAKHRICGRWLEAIPSAAVGTMLNNQTFRIATALLLGVPLGEAHVCKLCKGPGASNDRAWSRLTIESHNSSKIGTIS